MKKMHATIATFSVLFLSAACAGTDDGHGHKHGAASPMKHSGDMMKQGMKDPMKHNSGAVMPAVSKDKMMMADNKGAIEMTDGQIKRINKGSKKITIKHGQIKNLDMPAMTMVFRVSDEAMLKDIRKGDNVKFHVEDQDGVMVITEIMPAP